ncbi:hypothetical protein, partial [Chromobacterium amazonense]|uniref:hypothetical protein n=2 Tax=Chromobacterium amazonense TaxID=1382803 RepID=UPI0021B79983
PIRQSPAQPSWALRFARAECATPAPTGSRRGFAIDASLTQEVVASVVGLTCVANMASFCENARRMFYAKHIIHDVI